jgi:hypothetical protein
MGLSIHNRPYPPAISRFNQQTMKFGETASSKPQVEELSLESPKRRSLIKSIVFSLVTLAGLGCEVFDDSEFPRLNSNNGDLIVLDLDPNDRSRQVIRLNQEKGTFASVIQSLDTTREQISPLPSAKMEYKLSDDLIITVDSVHNEIILPQATFENPIGWDKVNREILPSGYKISSTGALLNPDGTEKLPPASFMVYVGTQTVGEDGLFTDTRKQVPYIKISHGYSAYF